MGYLKTVNIKYNSNICKAGEWNFIKVKIYINSNGIFYSNLDDEYMLSCQSVTNTRSCKIAASTLVELEQKLSKIFEIHYAPVIEKELVIIYNIESHVAFATNSKGDIFQNCTYEDTNWNFDKEYGEHYASKPAKNGYSLTIGAKAKERITYIYGDKKRVEYKDYNGNSSASEEHPAHKLNGWCAVSLDVDTCKVMPYSDEACLFFHNLIMGMVRLSKLIQENTFKQDKLLKLIQSNSNLLLPNCSNK